LYLGKACLGGGIIKLAH